MLHSRLTYIILMLVASCSYGLTPIIIEFGYRASFSVGDLATSQYGFAVIFFGLLFLLRFDKEKLPQGRDWFVLLGMGIAGAATSIFYFSALQFLPASIAIVLLFQFSWMTLIIEIVVQKKLPSREKWVGLAIIIIGTVFAAGMVDSGLAEFPPSAIILGILAAFGHASYLSLPEYLSNKSTHVSRSLVIMFCSALVLAPFFPPTYLVSGVLGQGLWVWGGLLALAGLVIPVLLMVISIPRIGGRMAGVLGTAELPTTIFMAAWLLQEQLSILRGLGIFLIICGIVISEKRNAEPAE